MTLRKVKNIYVDDESQVLLADCEGGSAVIGVVLNRNGMIPSGRLPVIAELPNPLPPAGPEWVGRMGRIPTEDGDELWVCILTKDGDEKWRKFRLNK